MDICKMIQRRPGRCIYIRASIPFASGRFSNDLPPGPPLGGNQGCVMHSADDIGTKPGRAIGLDEGCWPNNSNHSNAVPTVVAF
jgi:hypothetical protein